MPYAWSLTDGSLPPGLTLADGAISGTSTTTGTFNFVVQVSDGSMPVLSASNSLSITIVRPVVITTLALPDGVTNAVYSATLTAAGGTLPYAWSLTDGSLPPGLTLADGAISGTPTTTGTFNFVVQVSDGGTPVLSASNSLSVTIVWPVVITTLALPNGVTNAVYSATLTAAGGTSPYSWSLTDGSLPPGLTLADGAISGTPTTTGTFNFAVEASDSGEPALSASNSLSITVVQPVAITTLALPNGVTNEVYSAKLTADGGTLPYAWSLTDGSLPPGLTLADGAISGTPTTTGTFNFVVQVSDGGTPVLSASNSLSITHCAAGCHHDACFA